MWVLYFLLAVPLCQCAAVGKELLFPEERNGAEYLAYGSGIKNVKIKMEKIASEFLNDLIDAQVSRGNRQKREMRNIKPSSLSDKTGVSRLRKIKPFLNVCSRPTDIAFVDFGNSTYSICTSTPADDAPTTANIVKLTANESRILDSWFTNNPSKAVAFSYGQEVYILLADSGRGDGTDLIKLDVSTQKSHVDHTVHSKHATAIALWEMKTDGRYHLAIANSNGNKDANDLSTEIFTYTWTGTYFDKYSSIAAYDVKDIEPFHIHNMAYLAVANHRRGNGNYHVDSEILKYNLDQRKWLSFQKIRTYGAMDWEFFTLGSGTGKEFFLAVANYVEQGKFDINSVIYKFVKDKFVPFQCLLTRGATSIAALSDENRFLLAIANEYEAVYLYQYNGWRFIPASVQFTQSTMSAGVTSVSFHTIMDYEGQKLVLAVSNPTKEGPSLYEMELVKENALDTWHNDSTEWCMGVLDEIEDSESNKLLIDMNNVIYTDQEQQMVIEGNLNFRDGLEASMITAPKVIDIKERVAYDGSIFFKLKDLNLRLQKIEERLKKAEETLRKAVSINGDQTLSGNYSFKDVTFNCEESSCHFEKIETPSLNREDVTNLKNKVIFMDEDYVSSLTIENAKVNNLDINGLLDGVDVSNIVTKSGSHHITGTKIFSNTLSGKTIKVAGLVDGEKVTPYTVLLDGGFQNATGNLTFADIETSSLEASGLVNDVDLDFFYRNLIMSDKSYTVEGRKTFSDVTVRDLNVKSINGVDMSELWNNVMWRHEAQVITAPMSFSNLVAENNVLVDGYINGLKIPGPDVFLVNSSGVIRAHKLFKKTTKISKLLVDGSINGIRVLDNVSGAKRQLDVLLKYYNQVITGHKTFREINLDDHSYVTGRVNEIDLSELQESAWHKNTSTGSVDSLLFNDVKVKGPLTVYGLVSDSDLGEIYDKALKLEDTQMPNFESVTFEDGLYIGDLQSETVNGLDLTKKLVFNEDQESVKGLQVIKGFKTFDDMSVEADSDVLGLVNRINISFLHESIIRLGKQVVTAPLTAEGNLKIRSLTVKGTLNNESLTELVTVSGEEAISGNKIFSKTKAGNLYIGNLEVEGFINDIDFEAEVKNTMTYDGEQSVSGLKSVTGKITLSKNSNLNTDSLNDVDISSVWEDAVLVNVPQTISGNKVFLEHLSFDNLKFHESLDGVTEWDLKYNWMIQDLEQEVLSDVILAESAELSDITLSGFVNGVNIAELNSTTVKRTESAVITGPVNFENTVISYGDISLTGSVNDIDLSEEAILKSKHNIIVGEKEFLSDVTVTGDTRVTGLVDKVSIKDFCDNSVKQNIKLSDTTVIGNVVFEGGVKIGGVLAGVDIDSLYGLEAGAEETFINGLKTFENLTIRGPVTLYGNIGSEDIKFLKDTYMSLSRNQEVSSSLHFDKIKVQGTTSSSNFVTHDNKVNDIDLVRLQSSLLRTSGMQSANATYRFDEVTFADDVAVVGRVNAIEIPKGLMRTNRVNYVYNSKIFKQNLIVLGDLMMEDGKTVHETDLSEWERQSVLKDGGKYVIDGLKVLNNATMNDMRIYGTINGIEISEDNLLMIYGDQTVEGKKEISPITLFRDLTVHGLINGVDLDLLARRAAKSHMNNTFSGMKYFIQPVTIGSLETGLVNGVDIGELFKTIHTKLNFDVLSNRMTELKEAVSEMRSAFDNQAILLQYYEYFQGFRIPGSYLWNYVAAPDTKELLLLSDFSLQKNECTGIRIFELNPEKELFEPKEQILVASYAVAMKTIFIWDSTYLFVANSMPLSTCSSVDTKYSLASGNETAQGQILFWHEENDVFSVHQIIAMEPATDVVVFSEGETLCAVYTETLDTKLYCADKNRKHFAWRETLQTRNGRKMSLVEDNSDWPLIRLAVAGTDLGDNMNYVDIYNWKGEAGVFGLPVQRIRTSNANSVAFMLHPNMHEIFLVISEGTISGVGNVPRLRIYKLDEKENKLRKYQEIKDSGRLEWIILPSGDLILFVLDTMGNIKIYRHRYSSFVLEDTLYDTGATTLHAFERVVPEDSDHYLALAGPQRTPPHGHKGMDAAKILKSNIKGKRLLY